MVPSVMKGHFFHLFLWQRKDPGAGEEGGGGGGCKRGLALTSMSVGFFCNGGMIYEASLWRTNNFKVAGNDLTYIR